MLYAALVVLLIGILASVFPVDPRFKNLAYALVVVGIVLLLFNYLAGGHLPV